MNIRIIFWVLSTLFMSENSFSQSFRESYSTAQNFRINIFSPTSGSTDISAQRFFVASDEAVMSGYVRIEELDRADDIDEKCDVTLIRLK
jgi:hypothetical protein